MTLFGKLLVFINVIFSVSLLAVALAVYTNRVDWGETKASAEQLEGELLKRQNRLKDAWRKLPGAEAQFLPARTELVGWEKQRVENQQWYAQEKESLVRGPAVADRPILEVQLDKNNSQPEIDPRTQQPRMQPAKDAEGKPLERRESYDRDIKSAGDAITQINEQYVTAKQEAEKLTAGDAKVNKPGLVGEEGMPQRLKREQVKRERLGGEGGFPKPGVVNTAIEAQVLQVRRRALEARLQELRQLLGDCPGRNSS